MRAQSLPLLLSLALSATAVPFAGPHHQHKHLHAARDDTFEIDVQNNCGSDLSFGIFQVDSSFNMNAITSPVSIAAGSSGSIAAPYQGIGMRLSATADGGAAAQWNAQALFEFGYSSFNGQDGTAYDLSVMGGDVGVSVQPDNTACPSKICTPSDCSADQGWTNPDQVDVGSPADTVCYHGKTNFQVTWCP